MVIISVTISVVYVKHMQNIWDDFKNTRSCRIYREDVVKLAVLRICPAGAAIFTGYSPSDPI